MSESKTQDEEARRAIIAIARYIDEIIPKKYCWDDKKESARKDCVEALDAIDNGDA